MKSDAVVKGVITFVFVWFIGGLIKCLYHLLTLL